MTAEKTLKALGEGSTNAKLIVCERSGDWAFQLRRAMDLDAGVVFETRALSQVEEAMLLWPASIVGVEVDKGSVERVVRWALATRKRFPQMRLFALGNRRVTPYRPFLIEVGMLSLETSPRRLSVIGNLIQRHLSMASRQENSFQRQLLSQLPLR